MQQYLARSLVVGWRRAILIFYVILLGCVLPFICWGAWGTPGHPHAGPHLVFHHPPEHMATMQHAQAVPHSAGDDETNPVGRSAPDTISLVSLIIVPLLLAAAFAMHLRSGIKWLIQYIGNLSVVLLVPTPPPRAVTTIEP